MLSKKFVPVIKFVPGRIAIRQIHDNFKWPPPIKFKWEKNPIGPEVPATQFRPGHFEDPERFTWDVPYKRYPEKGDPTRESEPEVYYRKPLPGMYYYYLDRLLGKWLTGFIWFWLFYNLYYNYQAYTGHFYLPFLHEFTDEELGIPPDDAPDPTPGQYWGNHGKPHGTYR